MEKYIGFDIDSKKVIACAVQKGEKEMYSTIAADVISMRRYLKKQKADGSRVHLTFEISGQAGFIHDSLLDCVDTITISNPSKMTWIYRTAKKNDRLDSRKQAILLSIGEIPAVHMPSVEIRQWRNMILNRRKLVNNVTAVKNKIRAVLKSQGFARPMHRGSLWNRKNKGWLKSLLDSTPSISLRTGPLTTYEAKVSSTGLWCMNLYDSLEQLELLEEQVKRVTMYLDSYLSSQAGGGLLMSIPGVGPRTAEAVLAYTDDVRRFGNSKEYCSYFGLTPRLDESGTSRRLGHISKLGPSVVRWVLCESSWKVIRKSKGLRAFYERVMSNGQSGRKKIAIVAVCRRLLSIMRAMMLTGEMFNEELVRRECGDEQVRKAS
jgi:transposase